MRTRQVVNMIDVLGEWTGQNLRNVREWAEKRSVSYQGQGQAVHEIVSISLGAASEEDK